MFCQRCTEMLLAINQREGEDSGSGYKTLEYRASYDEFQKALLMGCGICRKMQDRGELAALGVEQQAMIDFTCTYNNTHSGSEPELSIRMFLDGPEEDLYDMDFGFKFTRPESSPNRAVLAPRNESRNTGSASCFALANHWLETCLHQHRSCERPRPPGAKDWRPTRLVYVGHSMGHLHLSEKEDVPVGVKYATLSHCWGRIPERLVLTKANIGTWKKGIPDLGRMKTFQDAVAIAIHLGMDYLWIDSLCIIQDSKNDWLQEASLMSDVYKFSQCTITATAAIDDTEGCFRERDLLEVFPTCFQIVKDHIYFPRAPQDVELVAHAESHAGQKHAELLPSISDISLDDDRMWWSNISDSPVSARSWIVQERLLSPRVLHYAHDGLFWECAELQASESKPFGMDVDSDGEFKASHPFRYQGKVSLGNGVETAVQELDHGFKVWEVAIKAYTAGNLTRPEDKLVAISAIAREVQHLLKCRYLAGLWEFDLVSQLGWYAENRHRPSIYRAPSWSWASVDGPIELVNREWTRTVDRNLVDILEAATELADEDEMGQVRGGHIRLLGQTHDIQIEGGNTLWITNVFDMKNRSIAVRCYLDDAASTSTTKARLCCLPLRAYKYDDSSNFEFVGLILETAGGGASDSTYRRVGLFYWDFDDHGDNMNHPLFSLFGKWEADDDGAWVFERNESAWREIVII